MTLKYRTSEQKDEPMVKQVPRVVRIEADVDIEHLKRCSKLMAEKVQEFRASVHHAAMVFRRALSSATKEAIEEVERGESQVCENKDELFRELEVEDV